MKKIFLLALVSSLVTLGTSMAQIQIADPDQAYSTNFNGWAGTLPTGYTSVGTGTSNAYRGTSVTGNTGGTYSTASGGFDWQGSGGATGITLTGSFLNSTGLTLTSLTLSYDALIINSIAGRDPGWAVTLSTDSGYTSVLSDLTWLYSEGAQTLSVTINLADIGGTDYSLSAGQGFTLAFFSDRGTGSGSSPKIGLNNISVTATAVPEPATYALVALGLGVVLYSRRKKK